MYEEDQNGHVGGCMSTVLLGAYTFTCEQEIVQQDTAMGVGVPEL